MDYAKYLNCHNCRDTGLYCKKHRREVELKLKKQELQKILETNVGSLSKRRIVSLLEAYMIWNNT